MGKKIAILVILTSLLNGSLIPSCLLLFNNLNKIQINIKGKQESEFPESNDEEIPGEIKLIPEFEDFILPVFLTYIFESPKLKFFSFHTYPHCDHFIEIISPPPQA